MFCNISAVETSLWACGASDNLRRSLRSQGLPRLRAEGAGWKRIAAEVGAGESLSIAWPWRVPKFEKGVF